MIQQLSHTRGQIKVFWGHRVDTALPYISFPSSPTPLGVGGYHLRKTFEIRNCKCQVSFRDFWLHCLISYTAKCTNFKIAELNLRMMPAPWWSAETKKSWTRVCRLVRLVLSPALCWLGLINTNISYRVNSAILLTLSPLALLIARSGLNTRNTRRTFTTLIPSCLPSIRINRLNSSIKLYTVNSVLRKKTMVCVVYGLFT